MYKPRIIEAENLFSFKSLSYEFNNGVTTLVAGENKDNDSQESNGSGKSSLIEMIAIALGVGPLRKVKNEEIISDDSDEAMTKLTLDNDILNETLVITRQFFRKSSQIVSLNVFKDGVEIKDPFVNKLSSVDEYNKAILDRIGLTRDEILSNFILSKHRYVNFLSVSDKIKKEVINQFSRGNAIDQAITQLKTDSEPIANDVNAISLLVASESGKLESLVSQLEDDRENAALSKKTSDEKIDAAKEKIAEYRQKIRINSDNINLKSDNADKLDAILGKIEDEFDACDALPPKDQLNKLIGLIEDNEIDYKHDFISKLSAIEASTIEYDDTILKLNADIVGIDTYIANVDAELVEISTSPLLDDAQHINSVAALNEDILTLSNSLTSMREDVRNIKKNKEALESNKSALSVKLMGKITCPKCDHEFLAAEKEFDIDAAEVKIITIDAEIKKSDLLIADKTNSGVLLKNKLTSSEESLSGIKKSRATLVDRLNSLISKKENFDLKIKSLRVKISTNEEMIKQISTKIDLLVENSFNDVIDHLENLIIADEDSIKIIELATEAHNGAIENLLSRIEDIKSNSGTLNTKTIEDKIKEIKKNKRSIEAKLELKTNELSKFIEQGEIFIDFKTHLANSKIDDLGNITNDFLETIGSDLRVEFSGFVKLANGKVRDKISIALLRDGVDAGSFGKFSGGEQARISLANILALSKLININCDEGKGLDLLILDEILESVDGSGLANMLDALNKTKITCLVVSHGQIAENYEYVQKVIKENGESRVETNI